MRKKRPFALRCVAGIDDAIKSKNYRLLDIVHADQKLYLVFEFLDVDLKRYMEAGNSQGTPISLELCQVCVWVVSLFLCFPLPPRPPRLNATFVRADGLPLPLIVIGVSKCVRGQLSGTPGADRVVTYGTPLVPPSGTICFCRFDLPGAHSSRDCAPGGGRGRIVVVFFRC